MVKIPIKMVKDEETAKQQKDEQQLEEVEDVSLQEYIQEPIDNSSSQANQELNIETKEVLSEEPVTAEGEDELTYLKKQLEAKEVEAKEHYEARLRIQAEFDNFKKRKEKEILDFRKYANENLIKELLIIVDDFERAIAAAEQTHKLEDFLKGIEMIFEKFLGVLKKKGVTEIEAQGQPFNPEIHEAVTQIETDDVEEGMVAAVFQKGYYLHDRVILAPKVGVAKKKETE
ncbi:protein grpE [Candidatus Vecturithrix granuli]|uniref:Protein GrpE n=1 Tax=Vecturithrix granuli TaxID=1499967 RepID=A0A081BVW5_VECG1|nr:protein grpE [Candidatus Vecturithrix granuli]